MISILWLTVKFLAYCRKQDYYMLKWQEVMQLATQLHDSYHL